MYNIFDSSSFPPSLFLVLDSVVAPSTAAAAVAVLNGLHSVVVLAGGVGADTVAGLGLALVALAVRGALEYKRQREYFPSFLHYY